MYVHFILVNNIGACPEAQVWLGNESAQHHFVNVVFNFNTNKQNTDFSDEKESSITPCNAMNQSLTLEKQ